MTGTFAVVVAHPDGHALTWAGTVAMHAHETGFRFGSDGQPYACCDAVPERCGAGEGTRTLTPCGTGT